MLGGRTTDNCSFKVINIWIIVGGRISNALHLFWGKKLSYGYFYILILKIRILGLDYGMFIKKKSQNLKIVKKDAGKCILVKMTLQRAKLLFLFLRSNLC